MLAAVFDQEIDKRFYIFLFVVTQGMGDMSRIERTSKNVRARFFAILAKNDTPENFERHYTCKYRKNSNNKFNKFLDLERDKAKKIARVARLTNLKKFTLGKRKGQEARISRSSQAFQK